MTLFAVAAVLAISVLPSHAWAAIDEQEPNDDFDSAKKIDMNEWVYAEGDQSSSCDYFEVNLPVSGSVALTYVNEKYSEGWGYINADIYDKYYEYISDSSYDDDENLIVFNASYIAGASGGKIAVEAAAHETAHRYQAECVKRGYALPPTESGWASEAPDE